MRSILALSKRERVEAWKWSATSFMDYGPILRSPVDFFYTCNDIYPECSSAELNNSYLLSSNHKFTWNTSRAAVLSSNIQCSIIIGFFLHGRSIVVLVLKKKEGKKERCTGGCRAVEMMRGRIKSLGGSCTPTWRCLWTLTSPRQLAQLALTQ